MLDEKKEVEGMEMPSQESETSSGYPLLTREEGRALLEEAEAVAEKFMQYLKDHDMLPKKCPARKVEEK